MTRVILRLAVASCSKGVKYSASSLSSSRHPSEPHVLEKGGCHHERNGARDRFVGQDETPRRRQLREPLEAEASVVLVQRQSSHRLLHRLLRTHAQRRQHCLCGCCACELLQGALVGVGRRRGKRAGKTAALQRAARRGVGRTEEEGRGVR